MHHSSPYRLCGLALLLCCILDSAQSALVSVYSLQRHGARNVLPKGVLLTEGDLIGGPTLLPQGQRQTYDAGTAYRARYLDNATCGATGTCLPGSGASGDVVVGAKYGVVGQPGVGFGNFDVYIRSSSLDRTIMSGLCFFNGVFPPDPATPTSRTYLPVGAQVVPIYTQSDSDDVLIRAYTKCPAYQAALDAWFRTPEFAAKANESAGLRASVQAAMPGINTSLANWWNVYDSINVYRTYGIGAPTYNFTDMQFGQIQELAYWLEVSKMRSSLTRNLLGGVTAADLVRHLQAAADHTRNGTQLFYKLVSLSGHYSTQLGLLAALEVDMLPAARDFVWYRPSLPRLAAVLAFELHAEAASVAASPAFYVRAVAQDGPAANYTVVPLPCASEEAATVLGTAGACTLDDFVSYTTPRMFAGVEAWCAACGNGAISSCRLARLQAAEAAGGSRGGGCISRRTWEIAATVVGAILITVSLLTVASGLMQRLRRRASPTSPSLGGGAGGSAGWGMASGPGNTQLTGTNFQYSAAHTQ